MSREAFEARTQPSLDTRAVVSELENKMTEALNARDQADEVTNQALLELVNGVKGDVSEGGEDGDLYEALGYVRKRERKSGLSRRGTAKVAAQTA